MLLESGFYWLENGIKIEAIAQLQKFVTQLCDMHGRGDVDGHLDGKHGCPRVCGRIAARGYVSDVIE